MKKRLSELTFHLEKFAICGARRKDEILKQNEFRFFGSVEVGVASQAMKARNTHLDEVVIDNLAVAGRTTCRMLLKSCFPRIVNVDEMFSHGQ